MGAENHGKVGLLLDRWWCHVPRTESSGVTWSTSQLRDLQVWGNFKSRGDQGSSIIQHKYFTTVILMHLCLDKAQALWCYCPGITVIRFSDFSNMLFRASLAACAETQCKRAYTVNGNALVLVTEKKSRPALTSGSHHCQGSAFHLLGFLL